MEEALSHQHLQRLPVVFFQFVRSPSGAYRLPRVTGNTQELTGTRVEDARRDVNAAFAERLHSDDFVAFVEALEASAQDLSRFDHVGRLVLPGGEVRWVRAVSTPEKMKDGSVSWHGVLLDVTEQKRAEGELRERERNLRRLVDTAEEGIWVIDAEGVSTFVNQKMADMLGVTPKDMLGKPLFAFMDEEGRAICERNLQRRKQGIAEEHDFKLVKGDGAEVWTLMSTAPILDDDGTYQGALAMVTDITQRRHEQQALAQSEARLKALLDAVPDLFFLLDRDLVFRDAYATDPARLFLPPEQFLGRPLPELVDPRLVRDIGPSVEQVFVTGRPEHVSYQMELEGGKRWYSGYIAPWGKDGDGRELVLFLARDETQRKRTEEAMLQAQKLESLGVLAGGIAHDFNNLLVGVLGYAELLHQQLPLEGKAAQHLRSIITSAQKAAALCQQLLAYAGKGTLTPRLLNLNALIDELAPLLRPSLAKNVELHQELATDLPPFMGDASQINQVIMNLLVNASEATADTGGRIVVGTSVEVLTGEEIHGLHQADAVVPGPHVRLEVRDTGPGMDRDTLEKVFDPFFSTKFAGRGLGLAAVSGVVRAHRGGLRVESVPGVGTVFHVLLPVGTVQASPEAPPREPAGRNRGGGPPGEVLVVDDEEMIRSLAREALEDAGWRVRVARHGKEAWELLQEHGDGLGAVVLDLTLPGMDGLEVLGLLRRRWPHLPVVLMSGYNEAAARERGYDAQGVVFLEKPFSPLLLVSVLCDLVAGTG